MERDYGEILCTAIDEIVSSRIQGIECDITKLCTIKDDSYAYEGKYVVSDGGAKFEAFSDDTSFRNGNNVLVTIPNGDFNLQKIIVGRVAATDTTPFKYTSPLSTMLKVEDDLMININESETGLLINKNNQSSAIKHLDIELSQRDINKYKGFTRLGISADFKCLLNNYDVTSGSYGIKLLIQADVMTKPGEINTDGIVELTLNTDDMYGNPYYFDNYFIQEKVFDISSITNIKGISVYLYQDGQFKDSSNNYIPWSYTELDGTITPLRNNLFVNNLQLYFGYELNRYKGETLEVFSYTSPLSFHQDREENDGNKKEMGLRWIHQNKDSSITILEENDLTDRHEIHWFRYNYGYEEVNEYAGANWEEITPKENGNYLYHSFEHSFNPNVKKQNEQIKVVGIIKEKINTEIFNNIFEDITSKYIFYESNNNRRQYKLKVIGQIIDDIYTWQYKLVYVNEIYDLLFENDKFYIIKNDNKIEVQILSSVNKIFFEKYNIRIKGSKNRYYIFFDKNDCSIKILNSNDFSIYWKQIEDEETKEKLNFYYYLDAENNEIELELVSDRIFEDMYKELATIKSENYETLEEYYDAIDNIYIKYNGTEPAIEYLINQYTSNILKFENEIQVVDDLTYRAATALAIICEDGSEGNYFIYDQNGKIINEGQGNGDIKYFNILYQGQPLDPKKLSGNSYIKWYLPFDNDNNNANVNSELHNTHTMVVKNEALWSYEEGEYKDKNNQQYFDVDFNDGVDYIGIKRTVKVDNNIRSLQTKQPYMIKNFLTSQDSNNIVRCELFLDNVLHKTQEELHFGKAGSNGTNTTLVLEMIDGKNALNVDGEDKSLQVRAILYNKNGKIIDFPETTFDTDTDNAFTGKDITWSWYSFTADEQGEDKKYIEISSSARATDLIQLDCLVNDVPQDNYYILKATVGGTPNLEAYLPIPIRTSNIPKIEGAKEVLYDYQGVPSYYSDAYVLYNENNQEIEEARGSWNISTVGTDVRYLPQLKNITRGDKIDFKALVAAPFYSQGDNSKVCVYCNYENYKWSQPILVAQNHYNFDVLNQWNGGLTLDENNGTILSTMLGAGRKNERNEYSGVLIGDIQGGTGLDSSDTHTGVYGLHNGELSYALKDDGTATFGKAGHGQIKIDGNSGRIYSPNYYDDNNSKGMLIDLDDGELQIKDNGYKKVIISPKGTDNNSYLAIYGQQNQSLIEIGNNSYFLRSYNKALNGASGYGTLFDLEDGSLDIYGPGGRIFLSGKEGKDLFRITNNSNVNLLKMNNEEYYLQSSSYLGKMPLSIIRGKDKKITYYLYNNTQSSIKNGNTDLDLSQIIAVADGNAYLVTVNKKLYGNFKTDIDVSKLNLESLQVGDKIDFKSTKITVNMGNYGEDNKTVQETITYSANEYKEWFISTLNILEQNVEPSGLHIDLINGKIDGYNLYLRGKGKKGDFVLDSGAQLTPFQIGKKFKVNWDGTLYCETVKYLGNKPPKSTYVINMNDNFYVTKGGGVGASSMSAGTGNFGGGWFGGTANIANKIKGYTEQTIRWVRAVYIENLGGGRIQVRTQISSMTTLGKDFNGNWSEGTNSSSFNHTHSIAEGETTTGGWQ